MTPTYIYRATVVRIVDGDTYRLEIDLGFRVKLAVSCRLHGVDTPEMTTTAGQSAREFVSGIMPPGTEVVIQSHKDKQSFDRWVCDVWLVSGQSLADVLRENGHVPA